MLMIWLFSLRVLMSLKKRWTLCMIIRDLTVNVDKTKVITFIYGDKIKSKLWINLFTLVFCKTSMANTLYAEAIGMSSRDSRV